MSILKRAFERIDERQQIARDEKAANGLFAGENIFDDIRQNPPVKDFLSALHGLQNASGRALQFEERTEGTTLQNAALEVTFGVSKFLKQYMDIKRDDRVLVVRFLPDSKMEIATDPVMGIIDFDAVSQPVSREALTEALSVYMEKQCRPDVLLGARRRLAREPL